jgi:hypothetical protein
VYRIPLIEPVTIVVSRWDPDATASNDPDGAGPLVPQDVIFGSPTVYESAGAGSVKADTRVYLPAVRLPAQLEVEDDQKLSMTLGGDAPYTRYVFVCHLQSLAPLGLSDALKKRDRIDAVEVYNRPGIIALPLAEPLYIYEVEHGSPGTGPTGVDLRILYTTTDADAPK